MSAPGGWEGILEPGEAILWQGRPRAGLALDEVEPGKVLFGLFYAGFALFWITGAASMVWGSPLGGGPFSLFPLFGVPFLLVGLHVMGGGVVWDAYRRSRTWYTLTDRRAFAATALFGMRRLRSVPVGEATPVERVDAPPDSIRISAPIGEPLVFERLRDMSEPWRHLRAIKARRRRA